MDRMVHVKEVKLQNIDVNIWLFLLPILSCVMFWYNTLFNAELQIGAYFHLLLALYMYKISYKKFSQEVMLSAVSFSLTAVLYTLFTPTKLNEIFHI